MDYADEVSAPFSDAHVDLLTKIPADKQVRVILLFLSEMSCPDFGPSLIRRYGVGSVVVAGGFVDRVITGSSCS